MASNKWHGIVEEVAARPESGASVEDQVRTPFPAYLRPLHPPTVRPSAQLLHMFAMYRGDNQDADFKHLHVYKRIDKCDKWSKVRRTIEKAKETYTPDTPSPGASDGRPDGNKGAKKGKHADAATSRVQESI